jgi:hypothetical protein
LAYPERLASVIADINRLAETARRYADRCIGDKGGANQQYPAFDILVQGLKEAFEPATECKAAVTTRSDKDATYGGDFLAFVEMVLPVANAIALEITKEALAAPADAAARGARLKQLVKKRVP